MRTLLLVAAWCGGCFALLVSQAANQALAAASIPAPRDQAFAGEIHLDVDASDVNRRIVHVKESISGLTPDAVLLYPKWLPGTHAPEGPIDRLAGLTMTAGGKAISWTRDTVNVYAFRPRLPVGTSSLEISFDYLSPTSGKIGTPQMTQELLILEWNDVILYPAGHFARQIPVSANAKFPQGWTQATALEPQAHTGDRTFYERVSLETLIDSPVYAGRYATTIELDPATRVRLDVFADRPELLEASPEEIAAHRSLVTQAYRLFGSHHYEHYDFLLTLSDQIPFSGLEHHQSSEDSTDPLYFVDWDPRPYDRDLLAHEYTHSWNGKFRRPADLWTSSYEVPMQNSLLWVYEGQTEYWGFVLTARAGLWSKTQALETWAENAAWYSNVAGRGWRPLQDSTNDEIINPRRPMSWESWQRYEDYYDEGALIWLDADTLIRERSAGKRSLDDFAARFFGVNDGSFVPLTYTFEELVKALNAVEPYDWAGFLRQRLDGVARPAPLAGLARGGYRLVYTNKSNEYEKGRETERKVTLFRYSLGVDIDEKDGTIINVMWGSPAFEAAITEGMQILAINGENYSGDLLKRTITAAAIRSGPIELILKSNDRYHVVHVDYHGGLRYPHLERDATAMPLLDAILAPRR
ncbi:MAG: M61 family metallopeptidase [Methylocella sp.]|jgi:predicted metalloprotease with PDZ domain